MFFRRISFPDLVGLLMNAGIVGTLVGANNVGSDDMWVHLVK